MDREFQARGIDFGTHINAYTTFDETVYYLGIPQPENSTLELGFAWMRDILDGMDLLQEELDIERGVVISELESSDSVGNRLWRKMLVVSICFFLPCVYGGQLSAYLTLNSFVVDDARAPHVPTTRHWDEGSTRGSHPRNVCQLL